MYKFLFLLLGVIFFWGTGLAAVKTVKPKAIIHYQLKSDTAKITVREFNEKAISNYRKNPDFNYTTLKVGITWWDRFWNAIWHVWTSFWQWVADELAKLFGHVGVVKNSGLVMRFIVIGIVSALVVLIIFKILGMNPLSLFRKRKQSGSIAYSESIENIHQINFDEAIDDALAIKNYRLAVRLLYLRCLKQLSDNNLIQWKIEKTNTHYLNELTDEEQRRQFTTVTRQFEYVWYGDFPIDGSAFQNINNLFQEFKKHLV